MVRDSRIARVQANNFRVSIGYEDIYPAFISDVIQQENPYNRNESVALFIDDPIRVPSVSIYYRAKITGIQDPYLVELCTKLVYLNENINEFGIKGLTTYVVNHFVAMDGAYPAVSHEAMFAYLMENLQLHEYRNIDAMVDMVVVYSKNSLLDTKTKILLSNKMRVLRSSKLSGELIHNAAIAAIEELHIKLQITNPRVLERVDEHSIKTVRTLKKHMRKDTQAVLEEENRTRVFKTTKVLEKFEAFLELPTPVSLRDAANLLGVSKGTIVEFKEIK